MITAEVKSKVLSSFPRRPWARNASHILYLGELMKSCNIHIVLSILNDLSELASWCANGPQYAADNLNESDKSTSLACLKEVGELCADFGFNALRREVERNIQSVEYGCNYIDLGKIAENLKVRIQDEYEDVLLLWIEEKQYYRQDNLFGPQVSDCFSLAVDDIKEAGTCYALRRYTACVFHLQHVMEVGLKALAAPIGESHNPNWDAILKKIDDELKKDWKERKEFFKGNEQKISDASAMLRAVKSAWRNPTMHVENIYDQEKTLDVWNAVKGFMNSLCAIIAPIENPPSPGGYL